MKRANSPTGDLLPLTRSQLLLWTGQRLAPAEPLYNMVLAFEIFGKVDTTAFQAAFIELLADCDSFRIMIEESNSVPRQRFLESVNYDLPLVDLRNETDPDAATRQWIDTHCEQKFSLEGLLFDSALLQVADDKFVWYLNQHHLITDAGSVSIIFARMSALYARAAGADAGELSIDSLPRFEDYVRNCQESEDTPQQSKAKSYWQQKLAEPPEPSTFYRRPPADRSGRTDRVPMQFGSKRTKQIRALANDKRFRAFTTDLASFQILATILFSYLYRVSGNDRLAIGVPSHGRRSAKSRSTAGLFIEIYPLVIDVASNDTLATLYRRVATAMQELLINAEPGVSSFESGRAFDVVLNYITATFGEFSGMPVASEWVHPNHGDRNHLFRLQVHDFDKAGALELFADLNVDTFVGDEKQTAVQHFLHLADALMNDPEKPIGAIPLLTGDSRRWLIDTLNATPGEEPVRDTVVAMFDEQARRTPDSVALVAADQSVTYRQLSNSIRSVAAQLAAHKVKPGDRVAVAMNRSVEAITTILAVMKSGAAFVPVDPQYPPERIRWILEDTAAKYVLTQAGLVDQLPVCDAKVIDIATWATAATDHRAPPDQRVDVDVNDSAYVIYTSGSTGKPNGVVIQHYGLANYISWCRKYYLQGEVLDFPLFSSMSFDLTITSMLLPLVSGGRLVIYDEAESERDFTIRKVIEDNAVDVIKLTPAHLALIHAMDFSSSKLKKLIVGGDDFKTDLAATISRYFDDQIEIYNEYGPTEGTVACMIHRYDPTRDCGSSVPIGRSIDNDHVYLLDQHRQPVPQGVVGQIFIGGAGVASGYLNQPERTAERFIANPFSPDETMYVTGDLARWNSDGVMEYLGRDDNQVKIRGVRIETAEIEAAMLEHPKVSDCVVDAVMRDDVEIAANAPSFCTECGLDAKHPTAQLNSAGVCRTCIVYRHERDAANAYFRSMDELRALVPSIKASATGEHDCIMLLSGGKDSTYALSQLIDLGLNPLVFTLDNGFISDGAKQNIQKIVDHLGLDLVVGETPAMNTIFADSLKRYSNVCEGCFKTIYTLSTKLAVERGISCIFTGLSRGQIFETRVADLFHQREFDSDVIDQTIIEARKAYHRMDDAVARNLDCSLFDDDEIFERVQYLDFYRYCDVKLDEVLRYLKEKVAWVRPADTGRSTNCLINDVGIYVHKQERGYHNYAAPYSWDVRLGHKQRDMARDELNDRINVDNVQRILGEIGYEPEQPLQAPSDKYLVAWYVADGEIPQDELRAKIANQLPAEFVPRQFVCIDEMPLTHNGKVDRKALPRPGLTRPDAVGEYVAPEGTIEIQLSALWSEILGVERIGANDSFFDLGGDSILNIQIVARAKQLGIAITPQNIFDHPTIRELAAAAGMQTAASTKQEVVTGTVPLTPIQQRFFERTEPAKPECLSQAVLLSATTQLDPQKIEQAWCEVARHHDALRASFNFTGETWEQVIAGDDSARIDVRIHELAHLDRVDLDNAIDDIADSMNREINITEGGLVKVAYLDFGQSRNPQMLAVIHHLVVDSVSWWILLQDLDTVYDQLHGQRDVHLPLKSSSIRQWSVEMQRYSALTRVQQSAEFWNGGESPGSIAVDFTRGDNNRRSARSVTIELDRSYTARLVRDVPAAFRVQVPEVLLTALGRCAAVSSASGLRVDLEGHGREEISPDIDLLRTVGWFTSIYPIDLPCDPDSTPERALAATKERLRSVPARGLDYGVLRYLHPDIEMRQRLSGRQPADVLFNYLGHWDQTLATSSRFTFARPIMAVRDPDGARDHVLEIDAVVFDDVLRINLTYSRNLHKAETIDKLAGNFHDELQLLIDASAKHNALALAPSDFPTANLDQSELDELLEEFGDSD